MPNVKTFRLPGTLIVVSLAALLAGGLAPAAADTPFLPDPDDDLPKNIEEGRKWAEEDAKLPPWPRDADLVEVKIDGPPGRFRHLIDIASLRTGRDDVVRYTLIAESAIGARNVTFEGLRCTPKGAYKVYAFGSDGAFEPAAVSEEWQRIEARGGDRVHDALWRHYLCVRRLFEPRPPRDQVRMLKSGRVPAVENAGFLTN
jgi:hypothetical protein